MAPSMASHSKAATPGGIDRSFSECSTLAVSDGTNQHQQLSDDPRIPSSDHFWSFVSEKNTFLCLADEGTWFEDVDFEARRSCSCPPRLESDDRSTPSLTPRSETASSRMSICSGVSDAAETIRNPAAASGMPSTSCPTPSPRSSQPYLESMAQADPTSAAHLQGRCADGGEAMEGGASGAMIVASRPANVKQNPKAHRVRGQNFTNQREDGAASGVRDGGHPEQRAVRNAPASKRCPKFSSPPSDWCSSVAAQNLGTTEAAWGTTRASLSGPPSAPAKQRSPSIAPAKQSTIADARHCRRDGMTAALSAPTPKATKQNQKNRKDGRQKHTVQVLNCVAQHSTESTQVGGFQTIAKLVIPLGVCTSIVVAILLAQRFVRPYSGDVIKQVEVEAFGNVKVETDTEGCWPTPFHTLTSYPDQERQRHELRRSLAVVTLYAPCPPTAFVNVAEGYNATALEWNFVKSADRRLVMQHHLEKPITWRGTFASEGEILMKVRQSIAPAIGLLSQATVMMYAGHALATRRWMATFLPEPAVDGLEFDKKYRQKLLSVFQAQGNQVAMQYMLTKGSEEWINSEFGVTSFPSLIVHPEYPGKPYVYSGDLSKASVHAFLQDVSNGCLDHRPHDMSAFFQLPRRLECDAACVLGKLGN